VCGIGCVPLADAPTEMNAGFRMDGRKWRVDWADREDFKVSARRYLPSTITMHCVACTFPTIHLSVQLMSHGGGLLASLCVVACLVSGHVRLDPVPSPRRSLYRCSDTWVLCVGAGCSGPTHQLSRSFGDACGAGRVNSR